MGHFSGVTRFLFLASGELGYGRGASASQSLVEEVLGGSVSDRQMAAYSATRSTEYKLGSLALHRKILKV